MIRILHKQEDLAKKMKQFSLVSQNRILTHVTSIKFEVSNSLRFSSKT